eukprot:scpid87483/ scgid26855/ 
MDKPRLPADDADSGRGRSGSLSKDDQLKLQKKLQERPGREQLVNQNILKSESLASGLHGRAANLDRQISADAVNRGLQSRPGVLDLVTRNIWRDTAVAQQLIESNVDYPKTKTATDAYRRFSVRSPRLDDVPESDAGSSVYGPGSAAFTGSGYCSVDAESTEEEMSADEDYMHEDMVSVSDERTAMNTVLQYPQTEGASAGFDQQQHFREIQHQQQLLQQQLLHEQRLQQQPGHSQLQTAELSPPQAQNSSAHDAQAMDVSGGGGHGYGAVASATVPPAATAMPMLNHHPTHHHQIAAAAQASAYNMDAMQAQQHQQQQQQHQYNQTAAAFEAAQGARKHMPMQHMPPEMLLHKQRLMAQQQMRSQQRAQQLAGQNQHQQLTSHLQPGNITISAPQSGGSAKKPASSPREKKKKPMKSKTKTFKYHPFQPPTKGGNKPEPMPEPPKKKPPKDRTVRSAGVSSSGAASSSTTNSSGVANGNQGGGNIATVDDGGSGGAMTDTTKPLDNYGLLLKQQTLFVRLQMLIADPDGAPAKGDDASPTAGTVAAASAAGNRMFHTVSVAEGNGPHLTKSRSSDLSSKTVSELKDVLRAYQLPITGTRDTLLSRLLDYMKETERDANEMHHSPMSMTTDTQSISPNSTLDRPRSTPPYFSAGVSVNAANVSDQDTITTALRDLINNPHDLEPLNLLPSERQQKLMSHLKREMEQTKARIEEDKVREEGGTSSKGTAAENNARIGIGSGNGGLGGKYLSQHLSSPALNGQHQHHQQQLHQPGMSAVGVGSMLPQQYAQAVQAAQSMQATHWSAQHHQQQQ